MSLSSPFSSPSPVTVSQKFDHYRDTRASTLDPCIQGILKKNMRSSLFYIRNMFHHLNMKYEEYKCMFYLSVKYAFLYDKILHDVCNFFLKSITYLEGIIT